MTARAIVFGMNSMFAVRHFLPEILTVVREMGMDVTVAVPAQPGEGPGPECPGVGYRTVPMKRDISPVSDLWTLWRLYGMLRVIRPAITNMSTPKMGLLGGIAALLAGVPHRIYTLRGLRYETTRGWKRFLLMVCERMACLSSHRVICISRSVKEAMLRDRIAQSGKIVLLGDRASEGIRIPAVLDGAQSEISLRHSASLRRSLGIPEEAQVLGFVGRLTRDKGIHELVECCQMLRSEGRNIHLLLLGAFESGDPVDPAVARWIRSCPQVQWRGYVADPSPYYPLMDVFVFPTHREGLGRVLLEAAAAGKPAVSTRVTGVVDVVLDGVTGILVPPGESRSLAQAVARILGDRDLAARMGAAARTLVREHFDNTVYLARLGNMLQSLVSAEAHLKAVHGTSAVGREVCRSK
jgi:glycosyltransferase involved in cell wall biosynthesis